jgi:lipopolysaccharide transport system ATP-binding protein
VAGIILPIVHGAGHVVLYLERLDLVGGRFFVDVGAYEKEWTYAYDYHWHVYTINVFHDGPVLGILHPPEQWDIVTSLRSELLTEAGQ